MVQISKPGSRVARASHDCFDKSPDDQKLDFAKNLRAMTEKKGSIAQVCRGLVMNRQQFNKYLSGTSFPGPQTLEKLAHYFGVDQHAMFDHGEVHKKKIEIEALHPPLVIV